MYHHTFRIFVAVPTVSLFTCIPGISSSLCSLFIYKVSSSGLMVSKHSLYVGGQGSILTAITTRTAAGGDAEHVSLNH